MDRILLVKKLNDKLYLDKLKSQYKDDNKSFEIENKINEWVFLISILLAGFSFLIFGINNVFSHSLLLALLSAPFFHTLMRINMKLKKGLDIIFLGWVISFVFCFFITLFFFAFEELNNFSSLWHLVLFIPALSVFISDIIEQSGKHNKDNFSNIKVIKEIENKDLDGFEIVSNESDIEKINIFYTISKVYKLELAERHCYDLLHSSLKKSKFKDYDEYYLENSVNQENNIEIKNT